MRLKNAARPVIAIAFLGSLVAGCARPSPQLERETAIPPAESSEASVVFELHLGHSEAKEWRIATTTTDSHETIYYDPAAELGNEGVAAARAVEGEGGRWQVEVELEPRRAAILAAITRDWTGKRIVLTIDGEVVDTPLVERENSTGRLMIGGAFSKNRAAAIAAGISRQP